MKLDRRLILSPLFLIITIVACSESKSTGKNRIEEVVTSTEMAGEVNNPILKQQWVVMPFEQYHSEQTVEVIDSFMVIEGDIIVGYASDTTYDYKQELAVDPTKTWPYGIIPYTLSESHPRYDDIIKAIAEVNSKTNLSLVPKKRRHKNYVKFVTSSGCSSWVGMKGGGQNINIGPCSKGSIMHEILHAAGFYHEHTRTDRDNYVKIHMDRIEKYRESNFKKYIDRGRNGEDLGPYDYYSIMHYSSMAFSKNGTITIDIKSPPGIGNEPIGQRDSFSTLDIKNINNIYHK